MSTIKAGNIKKGMYILHNDLPHYVLKTQFVSPGKGSAFTRTKLRNIKSGATVEFVFKSHDSAEELEVESKELQFLYNDGENVVFMDPYTYDQVEISTSFIGDDIGFLVPEMRAFVSFYDKKAIGVSLPPKVKMRVELAEEAVAGDRQNAGKKPATMETGLVVQVPLFVKTGDVLIVDTDSGQYVSRA